MALRQYTWLARSKPILLLLIAWGLSYAGDLAAFTAASVYAFRAGGAGLVAVLGLLKALPGAFLVPLVTSGSDRVRRERLLVATVVPRALLLGVAAAAMTGSGQGLLVVVLVGVEGGVASAFRQIQAALLPWLARTPDELTSANSAASVLQSAAMVGGPAIAAGLLGTGAAQVAMLVSCGLVAVAAVLLAGVRPLSSEAPVRTAGRLKQLKLDMMAGFDAGVRRRDAMALFVPAAAQTFGRGVLNVLTVVIALELFGLGSADVGWLGAVLGAGGLLVGPLAVMLVRGKRVARSFAAGVAGWGAPMILLGFAHGPDWPYLMFGVIGVANLFDDVGVYSSLQQVIPPRLMGRALGVRRGLLLLSMGLGSAVTPLLIDAWGARGTLIATGLLLVVLAARPGPPDGHRRQDLRPRPGPGAAAPGVVLPPVALRDSRAPGQRTAVGDLRTRLRDHQRRGTRRALLHHRSGSGARAKDGTQLRAMGTGDSFGGNRPAASDPKDSHCYRHEPTGGQDPRP